MYPPNPHYDGFLDGAGDDPEGRYIPSDSNATVDMNLPGRVVQKKSIFLDSATYLVLNRVFHAESKYRRKKKSDQRFSYGVVFSVSYGETRRKWRL